MKNFAVVIQGEASFVAENREVWKAYPHIFSTWEGSEEYFLPTDKTVFNKLPSETGPGNYCLQQTSTLGGLRYAKELGYTHVLKIRQDIYPTSPDNFIRLLDSEKFNFLCWHAHLIDPTFRGYLVDYLMSGPVDDMITLWSNFSPYYIAAELIITEAYKNNFNSKNINYFLPSLTTDNDLYWRKYRTHLSSYQQYPGYKTVYESFNYE